MSDVIPVKLPKNAIAIHLPSTAQSEQTEERILSDGDTRILSDGDERIIFEGNYDYTEVSRKKIPNSIITVHLEN